MALRKERVLEVVGCRARHADAFHHAARAPVRQDREGHDLLQAEAAEGEVQGMAGGLRGEASSPAPGIQSPADLHAGREMRVEPGNRQPDEADEVRLAGNLHSPQAEPVRGEVAADAPGKGVALGAVERLGQVPHDAGVAVDGMERREIGVAPSAQHQPWRDQVHAIASVLMACMHSGDLALPPAVRKIPLRARVTANLHGRDDASGRCHPG